MKRLTTLAVIGLAAVALAACSSTDSRSRKKNVKLPGEDEVSTLGWGRGFPGDPQPGVPGLPQSR